MNEKDWEKFFDLVSKIVNQPKSAGEKSQEFIAAMHEFDADGNFDELHSWFGKDDF